MSQKYSLGAAIEKSSQVKFYHWPSKKTKRFTKQTHIVWAAIREIAGKMLFWPQKKKIEIYSFWAAVREILTALHILDWGAVGVQADRSRWGRNFYWIHICIEFIFIFVFNLYLVFCIEFTSTYVYFYWIHIYTCIEFILTDPDEVRIYISI